MKLGWKGAEVRSAWGETGEVTAWEPHRSGMCDAIVRLDDGRDVWMSTSSLTPIGLLAALPRQSRAEAQDEERVRTVTTLAAIQAAHVRDRSAWPGCEFGKAHVCIMLGGAITERKG